MDTMHRAGGTPLILWCLVSAATVLGYPNPAGKNFRQEKVIASMIDQSG
jgi:hypothetical protein